MDQRGIGENGRYPGSQVLPDHEAGQSFLNEETMRSRKMARRAYGRGGNLIMAHVRRLFSKLAGLLRNTHIEEELKREIASHLALFEDDFRRQGMSQDEARIAARRAYGGVEQAKQLHREERSILWMEQTFADLRHACRSLLKTPGFSAVAILTLALGIGANIAIFTVVNAVLLRPLPFQHPERLVRVLDDLNGVGAKDVGMSEPEFEDLRRSSDVFD